MAYAPPHLQNRKESIEFYTNDLRDNHLATCVIHLPFDYQNKMIMAYATKHGLICLHIYRTDGGYPFSQILLLQVPTLDSLNKKDEQLIFCKTKNILCYINNNFIVNCWKIETKRDDAKGHQYLSPKKLLEHSIPYIPLELLDCFEVHDIRGGSLLFMNKKFQLFLYEFDKRSFTLRNQNFTSPQLLQHATGLVLLPNGWLMIGGKVSIIIWDLQRDRQHTEVKFTGIDGMQHYIEKLARTSDDKEFYIKVRKTSITDRLKSLNLNFYEDDKEAPQYIRQFYNFASVTSVLYQQQLILSPIVDSPGSLPRKLTLGTPMQRKLTLEGLELKEGGIN